MGRTVTVALEDFLAHLRADGRAEGTVGYRLHGLLRDGERDRLLTSLTPAVARQLYERRVADGVKPDTHRGELAVARQFAAWCVERGWIPADPFAKVKPVGRKRAGRGKPQLRVDEGRVLLDFLLARCAGGATPEPVAVLAALLLGPRAPEFVEREVRDLDDNGRLLWIPDSKSDSGRRVLEIPRCCSRSSASSRAAVAAPNPCSWRPTRPQRSGAAAPGARPGTGSTTTAASCARPRASR